MNEVKIPYMMLGTIEKESDTGSIKIEHESTPSLFRLTVKTSEPIDQSGRLEVVKQDILLDYDNMEALIKAISELTI